MRSGHRALRSGRHSLGHQVYLVTATTVGRCAFFRDHAAARAACKSFVSSQALADTQLLAWVLMPDHAHWLLQLGDGESLAAVVGRLKSLSARAANAALERRGSVWVGAYHDHALRREEDLAALARYVVMNPVRAGLVRRVGDYPYWNAVWVRND